MSTYSSPSVWLPAPSTADYQSLDKNTSELEVLTKQSRQAVICKTADEADLLYPSLQPAGACSNERCL